MRRELLHTPEGVRDIYNGECDKKQRIEQELHQTFLSFGYHTIQTPTFEFFDVFNREIGTGYDSIHRKSSRNVFWRGNYADPTLLCRKYFYQ